VTQKKSSFSTKAMGKVKQMQPLELFHAFNKMELDFIHPSTPASADLKTQMSFN